ncbi:AraC family transcriptional regulator [Chitinophaga sp. YR573]|uniref:AraC family transcriptional regulator n=1 Tax=Chitinophaga sp. YR573 TaxID=1881040 RepID=UPI000B7EEF0C|nr:AraC family transcriptional regulator [Chitinophaga sp. YR573]
MKILALHLDNFTDYARLRGMPYETTELRITIDEEDFYAIIEKITAYEKDELLGIRVGNLRNLNTLGAIYRISLKAVTIQEALYFCQAYLQETLPLIQVVNSMDGDSATIRLSIDNDKDQSNRIILETILMVVAREIKIVSGEDTEMTIYSPYFKTGYPSDWRKGESFMVKFQLTLLKAALKDNSHWGLDILIPEYLGLIEELKTPENFSSRIKKAMLGMAKPQLPGLETVAYAFNQTSRTLQRRLEEEGTNFRQIAEELKRRICNLLIRHNRYAITDLAYLLGYADSAAFIHSFKKWYGCSPKRFREQRGVS